MAFTVSPHHELLLLARSAYDRGEFEVTECLCRDALLQASDSPEAAYLLGVSLARQTRLKEAHEWLQKALALNGNSPEAWFELGKVFVGVDQRHDALICLRRSLEIQSASPEALLEAGSLCLQLCHFEESIVYYQAASKLKPWSRAASDGEATVRAAIDSIKHVADNWRAIDGGNRTLLSGMLKRRECLPYLLNELGLTGKGVEIGVQTGWFSDHLLSFWKGNLLYSIDPWRQWASKDYNDIANVAQSQQDLLYQETLRRLLPFGARSVVWRMPSKDAAELVSDGSLDFCYIDGDHSYAAVKQDLNLWHPKVRPGGLLAGHDYIPDGEYDFGSFGVQRAVKELAAELGAMVFTSGEAVDKFPCWFMFKR